MADPASARLEKVDIREGFTAVSPLVFVSYPYTHSLVGGIVWPALLAGGYYTVRRDRSGAGWIAALVLSHWVLDVVSHRPDVPLWPGGPKIGLGLWYSVPATLAVEFGLFAVGASTYARVTRARDRLGVALFASFVAVLAVLYVASVFGPPPPSVQVLAWSGILGWLFVAWGYWIDAYREPAAA